MELTRRSFLKTAGGAGLGLAVAGSVTDLFSHPAGALTTPGRAAVAAGYGALVPDPNGLLDLPPGFGYKVFSRHLVDTLSLGQPVPGAHDGMAAFPAADGGTFLIRNHELDAWAVDVEGAAPVPIRKGSVYDRSQHGGTTTIALTADNRVRWHRASLSGTLRNCAGGPTPWGTWLTCEETEDVIDGVKHGYVFEVDPVHDGDPRPIKGMGRFAHEAVAVNPRTGVVFLTEDASDPFGYVYRYRPRDPRPGRGNLHKGGDLAAMKVPGVVEDLSEVDEVGVTIPKITWAPVRNVDPSDGDSVRYHVEATHIPKAEGCWWAPGGFFFVSSYGYDAVRPHQGQLWRYDFKASSLTLVAQFGIGSAFDGPDNVTISPWGGAFLCEDGDGASHVVGLGDDGQPFAFARNAGGDSEFAGACFAPNGRTFFVNIQDPGLTFAITGPFRR